MNNFKIKLVSAAIFFSSLSALAGRVDGLPVGSFCVRQDNHVQGYSIHQDGTVNILDSLAGMPNPNIIFRATMLAPNIFVIEKLVRQTGSVIAQSRPFHFLSGQQFSGDPRISDGTTIYSAKSCHQ